MQIPIGPWFRFDEMLPPFDAPLLAVLQPMNRVTVVSIGRQTFGGAGVQVIHPDHAKNLIHAWCEISDMWGLIPPLGLSTQGKLDLARDQAFRDWHATAKELVSVHISEEGDNFHFPQRDLNKPSPAIDYENLPIRSREERMMEAGILPPPTITSAPNPSPTGENVVQFSSKKLTKKLTPKK